MVNCVIPTPVDNFLESDLFEFLLISQFLKTVVIAQLVRASDCGSEGRGFEPHWPPNFYLGFLRILVFPFLFT